MWNLREKCCQTFVQYLNVKVSVEASKKENRNVELFAGNGELLQGEQGFMFDIIKDADLPH